MLQILKQIIFFCNIGFILSSETLFYFIFRNYLNFINRLTYRLSCINILYVKLFQAIASNNLKEALLISVDYMQIYKADLLNAPVVLGSSGSVFGILLAFGMLFPNTLLYIYFAIPIKAKWFVILYGEAELYSGLANNSGDNVAHFAHLGGMLFGFFLIKYWQKNSNKIY